MGALSFSAGGNHGTNTPQRNHSTRDVSGESQRPYEAQQRTRTPRYWPTTPLTHDQAVGALHVAKLQDEAVLAIFRRLPDWKLTPSQVHKIGTDHGRKWLVTSVRRSITNLTDDGVLVKCVTTRLGPHGKPEHQWSLVDSKARAA